MPSDLLSQPIMYTKGVGPRRAAEFKSLGVRTVGDLLEHLPFRYELLPKSKPIGDVEIDEVATVVGSVGRVRATQGYQRSSVLIDVVDGTGSCRARWFNAPYLRDRLGQGQIIRLTGKAIEDKRWVQFVNPTFEILPDDVDPLADDVDAFVPVYSATKALPPKQIAKVMDAVLPLAVAAIRDFLPEELIKRHKLIPRADAIRALHRPTTLQKVHAARERLAYDELLLMQLAIRVRRHRMRQADDAPPIVTTPKIDERIRARLPFELTAAQRKAIDEIVADLSQARPMVRLLQGDVGCGKTAVAIYAALTAVANRIQVTILAPTEILARQTHDKIARYLKGSRVKVGLLVGQMRASERKAMLADLSRGEIDIAIGTHALLEDDVKWARLGLVIIDEQHRFGVAQRTALRSKSRGHHYLVMTATPIPRTLAMTVYGDFEVTTIDALPAGRKPVETKIVPPNMQAACWTFVRKRVAAGERVFVVYPLVEESETLDLKDAVAQAEALRAGELRGFEVGLLHGRMKSDEKLSTMNAFRNGRIQVLVSTTVVEVGVDVPEATMLIVEHAERFGLAQLHQLRGRVGRGNKPGMCLLFTDSNSKKAQTRLKVLRETSDGFKIAEADLDLRGPGEIVGTRQSGIPVFRAADLTKDDALLKAAIKDADAITKDDPDLAKPTNKKLLKAVEEAHPLAMK